MRDMVINFIKKYKIALGIAVGFSGLMYFTETEYKEEYKVKAEAVEKKNDEISNIEETLKINELRKETKEVEAKNDKLKSIIESQNLEIKNKRDEKRKIEEEEAQKKREEAKKLETNEEIFFDTVYFNREIKGRGNSDSGRSEPEYVGLNGYVAIYHEKTHEEMLKNKEWKVDTYKKIDYDHYEKNGTLNHKTGITVLEQNLKHEGYGKYTGYLEVVLIKDENKKYIIDVKNFITNNYWEAESPYDAIYSKLEYGYFMAEYNQKSDKMPVEVDNEIVKIKNGTKILVSGKTGLYGRDSVDDDLREIEGYYLDSSGKAKKIFFNKEDLKTIL